jgi:Subtilase family
MRFNPIPLIAAMLFAGSLAAQSGDAYTVYLKSGNRIPEKNITTAQLDAFNNLAARTGKPVLSLVQFNNIPADGQRTALAQAGIQLLDYIPNNAFTALISQPVVAEQLLQWDIRSLAAITPAQKMLPALNAGIFPAHAVKIPGTADLWITYVQGYSFEEVIKELRDNNFDIQSTLFKNYRTIAVRINAGRIHELAALPFIEYVDAAPGEMQWLNNYSRVSSRANVLSKETSIGGRGLKGSGITVGIGDNADPVHVDFSGRLISRAAAPANYHGTHVHGTAGGAGIWNELYTGHAPKARLISQVGTGIWINAAAYYSDYRMVITNNSYGNVTTDCAYSGFYDNYSRFLDVQAFSLPKVLNTFAAGNSGIGFPINCSPFPAGYKSVVGGMQASKNTLTIGNTMSDGVIFPQSSRGPVKDGRLKPEIVAHGSFVVSASTPSGIRYTGITV